MRPWFIQSMGLHLALLVTGSMIVASAQHQQSAPQISRPLPGRLGEVKQYPAFRFAQVEEVESLSLFVD